MKSAKLLVLGAAVAVVAQVIATPDAARRVEAEAEAKALFERLSPNDAISLLMMNSVPIKEPRIQQ